MVQTKGTDYSQSSCLPGEGISCRDSFIAQTSLWCLVPFQGALMETQAKCPFKISPEARMGKMNNTKPHLKGLLEKLAKRESQGIQAKEKIKIGSIPFQQRFLISFV